jgi:bacteriocin-like protein
MKKAQTKTEKKDNKAVVELSEKELAVVAGGRRIIVYQ